MQIADAITRIDGRLDQGMLRSWRFLDVTLNQACRDNLSPLPPKSAEAAAMALKYAHVLESWVESFAYDFRDERMMVPFKELTQVWRQ